MTKVKNPIQFFTGEFISFSFTSVFQFTYCYATYQFYCQYIGKAVFLSGISDVGCVIED